jgi:hypothetical protein
VCPLLLLLLPALHGPRLLPGALPTPGAAAAPENPRTAGESAQNQARYNRASVLVEKLIFIKKKKKLAPTDKMKKNLKKKKMPFGLLFVRMLNCWIEISL